MPPALATASEAGLAKIIKNAKKEEYVSFEKVDIVESKTPNTGYVTNKGKAQGIGESRDSK